MYVLDKIGQSPLTYCLVHACVASARRAGLQCTFFDWCAQNFCNLFWADRECVSILQRQRRRDQLISLSTWFCSTSYVGWYSCQNHATSLGFRLKFCFGFSNEPRAWVKPWERSRSKYNRFLSDVPPFPDRSHRYDLVTHHWPSGLIWLSVLLIWQLGHRTQREFSGCWKSVLSLQWTRAKQCTAVSTRWVVDRTFSGWWVNFLIFKIILLLRCWHVVKFSFCVSTNSCPGSDPRCVPRAV